MASQNAIMGDDNFGTDLPESQVPEQAVNEETRTAQVSKSPEYQAIKAHLTDRIEYYQRYLPGQVPVENVPEDERSKYWAVACMLISEFNMIINSFEGVTQAVEDARRQEP